MLFREREEPVREVLEPSYVASFSCDGSVCGSRCCRGHWAAVVDEATLARYRSAGGALGEEIRRGIVRNPAMGDWTMRHQQGSCAFLRKDGLCSLQKRFGTVALSDVCAEFPRRTVVYGGTPERTLCMTCPVAMRLALLESEPMTFCRREETLDRPGYYDTVDASPQMAADFHAVRSAAVALLQERRASLDDRLVALWLFLSDVSREMDLWDEVEPLDRAAQLAGEALSRTDGVRTAFPLDEPGALAFFTALLPELGARLHDTLSFTKVYETQIHAIFGDGVGEEALRSFAERREAFSAHVEEPYGYVLENILVHELFGGRYLSRTGKDSMVGYELFVLVMKFVKFLAMTDVRIQLEVAVETDEASPLATLPEPAPQEAAVLDALGYLSIHMNHTADFWETLYAIVQESGLEAHFYETVMI